MDTIGNPERVEKVETRCDYCRGTGLQESAQPDLTHLCAHCNGHGSIVSLKTKEPTLIELVSGLEFKIVGFTLSVCRDTIVVDDALLVCGDRRVGKIDHVRIYLYKPALIDDWEDRHR